MSKVRILPGNIANMIAAGEVVQRPASVVKELVENAVDAGASEVTVVVTDAGRTLIQVIDDGSGMSPEDAVMCFERHATSKIAAAEDLEAIGTYGFRGEALASIAAVSEVTLKTRRQSDDVATQVRVTDGKTETSKVAAPKGSSFAVRNLFFNTPARRKFLKSDAIEFKHIVEEFTRVALTRPELAFNLTHNGRKIFVLKAAKSLKFRILDLLGSNVAEDIVDVSASTSLVTIDGFVGRPDASRKTPGNQFFFVNGRYFRSPYMHKAVMKAYEDFIPEGVTPPYFLYMHVDPHTIDVNIHPTKTEIKFEEDGVIFQIIYAAVKETLGKHSFGASIDFEAASDVQMPSFGKSFDAYHPVTTPAADFDQNYNPFESAGQASPQWPSAGQSEHGAYAAPSAYGGPSSAVSRDQDYGKLFEEKRLPSTKVMVLGGKYILAPAQNGVMVVNARRALERILYERFLASMTSGTPVTQATLFPVQVNVGVQGRLTLDAAAETLTQMGFDISPFGNDTVVVNGVPEGYSCETGKVEEMVTNLLLILSEDGGNLKEALQQSRAQKLALLGASTKVLSSPMEAQNLLDRLLSCDTPEMSPTGHRILNVITTEELDRKLQ